MNAYGFDPVQNKALENLEATIVDNALTTSGMNAVRAAAEWLGEALP